MEREGRAERKTRETEVRVDLRLDGSGEAEVETGMPFFDHMLQSFARHGLFDLRVRAKGDLQVDPHHTVEDVGLVLGDALRQAVGDGSGLVRFGTARIPMADALATVDLDLSNRPFLVYSVELAQPRVARFDATLIEDFMYALAIRGGLDLHVAIAYGHNVHHCLEAIFKGLGRALDQASRPDPRIRGPLSTKGAL
ncbi:MAG: imidazoleglycerol-phosphate dehydratase HisB [Myxococcota bacterium]